MEQEDISLFSIDGYDLDDVDDLLEQGPVPDLRGNLHGICLQFFVPKRRPLHVNHVRVGQRPIGLDKQALENFFGEYKFSDDLLFPDWYSGELEPMPQYQTIDYLRHDRVAFELRLLGLQNSKAAEETPLSTSALFQRKPLVPTLDALDDAMSSLSFIRSKPLSLLLSRISAGMVQERKALPDVSIISTSVHNATMITTDPNSQNTAGVALMLSDLVNQDEPDGQQYPIHYGIIVTCGKYKVKPINLLAGSGAYMSIPYVIDEQLLLHRGRPFLPVAAALVPDHESTQAFAGAYMFHRLVEISAAELKANITDLADEVGRIERDLQAGLTEETLAPANMRKLRSEFTNCIQRLRQTRFEHHEAFLVEASQHIIKTLPGGSKNEWQPQYLLVDKATLRSHYEGLQDLIEIVRAQITDAAMELQQKENLAIAQRGIEISENSWKISQQGLEISENSWRIAQATRKDSQTMRAIAFITMIFLPATFVSSFFGMNFFNGIPDNPGFDEASAYVWIYFLLAVPLTLVVLGGFKLWEYTEEHKATRRHLDVVLRASHLHDWVHGEKSKPENMKLPAQDAVELEELARDAASSRISLATTQLNGGT